MKNNIDLTRSFKDRCYHIAGDGRRLPGLDAEQRRGDLLVTGDFQHAYIVVSPGLRRRLEGPDRDSAITRARELHAGMLKAAITKDLASGKRVPVVVESAMQYVRRLGKQREDNKYKPVIDPNNFNPEDVN